MNSLEIDIPTLVAAQQKFIDNKENILRQWMEYKTPKMILEQHQIDTEFFISNYAGGVFDYFMGVIAGEVEIGNCPVMQKLLAYLKNREISADELFELCSHFRRSMIDFSYDARLNSKTLFDEVSYIFDKNFRGILKYYTDTIFQKLVDARQEALQASQAREYFLSNMSHEIRTPLNAILGFVNLLIEEDMNKKHRNYLEIIHSSGENLLSIINDILDFSKLRSGEFTIEPKIFSVHDEVSHALELFVASATSKDITITSFIDPRIPRGIMADPLRIKQILSNFLSNAIKFTPSGGRIHVEAACHDGELKISVEDNGIGIKQEDMEKIFSAFAQATQVSEQKDYSGTGLGLSICSQLAKHMNGVVDVSSKVGEGSIFWMQIPVEVRDRTLMTFDGIEEFQKLRLEFLAQNEHNHYKVESFMAYATTFDMNIGVVEHFSKECDVRIFVHESLDEMTRQEIIDSKQHYIALMSKQYDVYEPYSHIKSICFPLYCSKIYTAFKELLFNDVETMPASEKQQKFKGHILVAEDNEANQELIKIILSKYGLSFDLAHNGLEAFELFKFNSYDLILMDEQMPVMDGNEAVRQILAYEDAKGLVHTPISALTANVIKGARERGLVSGFDAFLGKPIVLKDIEKVFSMYLKVDHVATVSALEIQEIKPQHVQNKIVGLDEDQLMKELMLTHDELVMLLDLFLKKMQNILPDLQRAIGQKDYKNIALLSHSIKGSSGNFRIEELQKKSSEMEKMAKEQNSTFDYVMQFEEIVEQIEAIEIRS